MFFLCYAVTFLHDFSPVLCPQSVVKTILACKTCLYTANSKKVVREKSKLQNLRSEVLNNNTIVKALFLPLNLVLLYKTRVVSRILNFTITI